MVPKDTTAKEIKEMKEFCPTYKAGDTITSLVNVGMKKLKHEWGFLIFGGSRIQAFLEKRILTFATSENDVIFPVVDYIHTNFVEGSFNGVLINKKFFEQVGDFPTAVMQKEGLNDFELAKFFWATEALEHGVKFKGIVGMRTI